MWNKNKKANKMFDWNVYVCHIFGGGEEKEFIGCHQVGHALHENWWNQHLEQFIYICSDTLKTKKKIQNESWAAKKSSLGKPERKYVLTTEELRRNDAYTQKKKKPKLKMEPQKRKEFRA